MFKYLKSSIRFIWHKPLLRYLLLIIVILTFLGITLLIWANYQVANCTKFVYSSTDNIPSERTGLVLGTSKTIAGRPNIYFTYRIKAAAELYHAGVVKRFILSGDNRSWNYNEPRDMRDALHEAGVPLEAMELDFAGFRTLDSVLRSQNVFDAGPIIVISQKFHCERAIYIARAHNIDAIGYSAQDATVRRYVYRRILRETGARLQAWLDVNIFQRQPYFRE